MANKKHNLTYTEWYYKFEQKHEFDSEESRKEFITYQRKQLQDELIKTVADLEEATLQKALAKHLKRIPTEEDYKKCQMLFKRGDNVNYYFSYDGTVLGYVKKSFDYTNGAEFKIEFVWL